MTGTTAPQGIFPGDRSARRRLDSLIREFPPDVGGEISRLSRVRATCDVTGEMDLVCICHFRDKKELDEFQKDQPQGACVERAQTNSILNVLRDERRTLIPAA